jgi:hypothetical protein
MTRVGSQRQIKKMCLPYMNINIARTVRCVQICFTFINPLNAELNPICHLLVLLGDLTFMGPCIVIIFQYTCTSLSEK